MPKTMNDRIVFLDYMRIFAFVSVVIGHKFFPNLMNLSIDPTNHITIRYLAEALLPLCYGGAAGVIVFFLTSGYIITHVLQTETTDDFIIKRFFRIYPLYITAVIVEILLDYTVSGTPVPNASVLIPRLLLIGDFFDTPYGLGDVEWTLRIEVFFYIFMAVLKAIGLFKNQKALPFTFVAATALLIIAPAFPAGANGTHGYFTIYAPILFVGACVYLAGHSPESRKHCIIAIIAILFSFLILTSNLQPKWRNSNYMILAVGIFTLSWMAQKYFSDGAAVTFFSNLTYAVYLFHNWIWQYLVLVVNKTGITIISPTLQILILLFAICYAAHRMIEISGLKAGKLAMKSYKKNFKKPPIPLAYDKT